MRNNDLRRARTGLSAAGRTRIPKKNRLCFTRKLINKNRFPVSDILILRFPQLMKIFFFSFNEVYEVYCCHENRYENRIQ